LIAAGEEKVYFAFLVRFLWKRYHKLDAGTGGYLGTVWNGPAVRAHR